MSHKKILVIRLSAMGDVAIMAPLFKAFTVQYPEVKLTVLTKPFFKPIFNNLPNVEVITIDVKGVHKGVLGLRKLAKELKEHHFDAVADLHNVLRTKVIKFYLPNSIPFKQIDKGRKEKKALISGKLFKQLPTSFERYNQVFHELGFPINTEAPSFLEKPKTNKTIQELYNTHKSIIGIAPLAAFEGKTYPLDKMREVIEKLPTTYSIVLFGGASQKQELDGLITDQNRVINVAGVYTFEEELQLIAKVEAMISMDSGNAHLAAMYGVKTLTIWGITHPYAGFYPYNQSMQHAVLVDRNKFPKIPTSIYGNKAPENYLSAIATIAPQAIVDAFNRMMS